MRAKSEYPTRHGDQHAPDGSDPIIGIGGIEFNDGTYGPENVGDWLYIETTSFGGPLSAGVAFQVEYDFRTELNGGEWNLNTNSGVVEVSSGEVNVTTDGGGVSVTAGGGGSVLIDASGGTPFSDGFIDILGTSTINIATTGPITESADDYFQLDCGNGMTMTAHAGGVLIKADAGNVELQVGSGQQFTVLDSAGNPKIRWTEGTNDLHIPTGGTIVANL